MTSSLDGRLVLDIGSHRRIVTLTALSEALGVSRVKVASALLTASHPEAAPCADEPVDARGRGDRSSQESGNVNGNEKKYSSFPLTLPPASDSDPQAERFAAYLADRLDDWKSYRFFLVIVCALPREIVLEALSRALDVPERAVRRSRGAYFTALVRRRLAGQADA
jgi:hypothetical protein